MIGRSIIDQFIVRSKLADGGMGGVYLADQPSVGRTAVIKVIHPWLSQDPGIAARFAAEARAAARLQNPHIVSIYNYGKLPDGTLFLAMEHIQGSTLAETLESKGRLGPSRAVAIATQCCEALAEAHRRNVIHRDVKPSNIILQTRHQGPGFAKMLDFGVATIDDRDAAPGRSPAGTPCYMSPEQLSGAAVDGRSDIYSLAIVVYEMIVGQPPFLASSPEDYSRLHREVPPPAPSALVPEVQIPPPLEACLMRALAKEPHARPQSAERFSEELWSASMATASMPAEPDLERVPLAPPALNIGRAVVLGAALASGLAASVYFLANDDDEPAASAVNEPPTAPAEPSVELSSPAHQALMKRSIVELEAELERAAVLTGRDSRTVNAAMIAYRREAHATPLGLDAKTHTRAVLARLILRWAHGERGHDPPGSIAELEAVFLRMKGPLEVRERLSMLHELKNREDASATAIQTELLEWIEEHGLDYQSDDPR